MNQHADRQKGSMAHRCSFALIAFLLFAGLPMALHSQIATGGIAGTVTDTTGAKIVGAAITLTNTSTGVASATVSTSTGTYFFNAVLAGTYSLQVTQRGFKVFRASGIEIHAPTDG